MNKCKTSPCVRGCVNLLVCASVCVTQCIIDILLGLIYNRRIKIGIDVMSRCKKELYRTSGYILYSINSYYLLFHLLFSRNYLSGSYLTHVPCDWLEQNLKLRAIVVWVIPCLINLNICLKT